MAEHAFTTVVRAGDVWVGGESPSLYRGHDLVIEDGVVASIEPTYEGRADLEVDATHGLVLPGFVNSHTHCGSTPVSRGVSEDLDLPEAGAFYHSLIPLLTLANTELSEAEFGAVMAWDAMAILLGGATTIVEESFHSPKAWLDIVERFGFRCSFGLTYPGNVGAIGYVKDGKVVRDPSPDLERVFEAALNLYEEKNNTLDGRLTIHLSPHASDTVPAELLELTQATARARGMTVHLHLAQHLSENNSIADRFGTTPVKYLEHLGFLGDNVLATHSTYTDAEDWSILAATGTNVVHCAYRKAKEGLISPFWEYLARGTNVVLATDSFHHSLVDDFKLAAVLGKIDQHAVGRPSAHQIVRCATANAAKALGRPDLGHLNPGAAGDVVVFDMASPYNSPVFDPIRSLVYYSSSRDIRHSLVRGQLVVADGAVLGADAKQVYEEVSAVARRLWEKASLEPGILPPGVQWYERL